MVFQPTPQWATNVVEASTAETYTVAFNRAFEPVARLGSAAILDMYERLKPSLPIGENDPAAAQLPDQSARYALNALHSHVEARRRTLAEVAGGWGPLLSEVTEDVVDRAPAQIVEDVSALQVAKRHMTRGTAYHYTAEFGYAQAGLDPNSQ